MKVGILVECGRDGLEDVVCPRICELLQERTGIRLEPDIVAMDDKAALIRGCGPATAALLKGGCERVVILWDERPAWPDPAQDLCWSHDRRDILASLREAGVANPNVSLVCIEREFESWLLFDERMLSGVLSTETHRVRVRAPRNPHRIGNPKGALMTLFKTHHRWYDELQYAPVFARCLANLTRLRGCATFRRFAEKVTGEAI
jgi:hypothetical protein